MDAISVSRFWRRLLRYGICRLSRLISQLQSLPRSTPEVENAFICHLRYHWFCIRKVDGEWYNFDSLYAASEHLSKFYLSAYLDMLKGFGWSIFVVRGNFPKECPISGFESANGFGQWLSPEDAERITKSQNITQAAVSTTNSSFLTDASHVNVESLAYLEDKQLNEAIAACLLDSSSEVNVPGNNSLYRN